MAAFTTTNMPKLLTPENLAEDNFKRRKKAFLAEVDLLGAKYEIFVHAILEAQKATNPDTKIEQIVYVPRINILDRKGLKDSPTKTPDEPKKSEKVVKGK
jgi:hypothetical protein